MIDVYAPAGTFPNERLGEVLKELTDSFLRWTDASDIPIARDNAGAFLHILPPECVTAGGRPASAVRVDLKVPDVVLSTVERRRGFIADATEIVRRLSVDGRVAERAWVTVSNTADGGWGIGGRGLTNAELDDI
jgi:hypothetical protein